jgi:alanine racemase
MTSDARAEVVVDLAAYRQNLQTIASQISPASMMAVVKADAYGHGLEKIVRSAVASGVNSLGALDLKTAFAVRGFGLGDQVDVFAWLHSPQDDFAAAVDARIDLGVSTVAEVEAIAGAGARQPARLHLKIDTGLHRNGASVQDWPEVVASALAAERRGAALVRGVWTHIAESSDDEDTDAMRRFDDAITVAERLGARFQVRHLAASAAGFARADSRYDLVRVGAFTYGIAPGGGIGPHALGLVPVMTLTSRVDDLITEGGRSLAAVPIGFGDGLPGELAGRASVSIRGRRSAIVAVEVDRLLVELTEESVQQGDHVVLFGAGDRGDQTLQEWADATGTIGEEFVVRLGAHLARRYVNE